MIIKQGDKFLVEVEVTDTAIIDGSIIVHSDGYDKNYFIHKKILEKAKKIEPTYEDGEWYWASGRNKHRVAPWQHINGKWTSLTECNTRTDVITTCGMSYIGPKIEK